MSQTATLGVTPEQASTAMIAGGIIAVLGILAIIFPFFTGISLSILLGVVLVVGALVHVAHAFSAGTFWNVIWQVLLGILYGAAGIAMVVNPVFGMATLTILVIAFLFANGIIEIVWAFTGRSNDGWLWLLASGIISVLLAGLLLVGFPSTALWAVGLLFGVNLLVTGVTLLMVGMRTRRTTRADRAAGGRGQQT